ncbi:MAG: hypothetical protein JWN85_3173, partial [Gammaproteobacteria bacterium]|nr:hypothetical protein [Gammaproteobacteria bacterium]
MLRVLAEKMGICIRIDKHTV